MTKTMKRFAVLFLLKLVCLQAAAQNFSWLDETAYWGLFSKERCTGISSISISGSNVNDKLERKKRRNYENVVEFDALGRIITSWEYERRGKYIDSLREVYQYGEDGCLESILNITWPDTIIVRSGLQFFCSGTGMDSIVRTDYHYRSRVHYIRNLAHQITMVETKRNSIKEHPMPDGGPPYLSHDTTFYKYDANGHLAAIWYSGLFDYISFNFEHVSQEKFIVHIHDEVEHDLVVELNAIGLPVTMTDFYGKKRNLPVQRATFTYVYR